MKNGHADSNVNAAIFCVEKYGPPTELAVGDFPISGIMSSMLCVLRSSCLVLKFDSAANILKMFEEIDHA